MAETVSVPADLLRRQLEDILTRWRMSPGDVVETASVMIDTDLRGIDSHGIAMLPVYADLRKSGKIDMTGVHRVVRDGAGTALIDAGRGLGHPAAARAMDMAIAKARAGGLGAVAVRNSNHYGAAGAYALRAAEQGLIGFAATNAGNRAIVPTRARAAVFGTNPLAFAAPARRNPPFVFDMATSTVAVGKIKLAWYARREMPRGWVMSEAGEEITDPDRFYDRKGIRHPGFGLSPLGGLPEMSSHKGYGLAAMVEILSSMLSGAAFIGLSSREEHDTGHFFMALDPGAFREDDGFLDDMDAMIDSLHDLEPVDPAAPVLVAGDPERAAKRTREADGIPMPAKLCDQIRAISAECGAEDLLAGRVTV